MHATQHPSTTGTEPTRRADGKPETDADRRFFALREKGWTGWITLHGYPTDVDGVRLDLGDCDVCGAQDVPVQLVVTTSGGQPRIVCADGMPCVAKPQSPIEPDTDAVPAAPVLRSAALYLERHGWIQGAYYDPTATVFTPAADMVGAIGMVCYGGPCEAPAQHFDDPGFLDFEEAVLHLDRYLLVEDGSEAYEFNDAPGRRAEDVLRVLRDAAARTADELIDALRVLDAHNPSMATRVRQLTPGGIWGNPTGPAPEPEHVDDPHEWGNLYDCPACEAECYCTPGDIECVHCSLAGSGNLAAGSDGGDAE